MATHLPGACVRLLVIMGRCLLISAIFDFPPIHFSNLNADDETTPLSQTTAVQTTPSPIQYGPMSLSPADRDGLLQVHNTGRASVDPPATDMNKVVWSTSLADKAALALEGCVFQISTSTLIARERWLVELTSFSDINEALADTVTRWYGLAPHYDYHRKSCGAPSSSICEVYKLLVWSSMTAIGCSQHYCEDLLNSFTGEVMSDKLYWKCYYEHVGRFTDDTVRPYTNGTADDICSQCESGSGWCENGLCSGECEPETIGCTCQVDELCSGKGVFNQTACACSCNNRWVGNNCNECRSTCEANEYLVSELCRCACNPGYHENATSLICEDVDECETSISCDHTCVNDPGSYHCTCFLGFTLKDDGQTCESSVKFSEFPTTATAPALVTTNSMETTAEFASTTVDSITTTEVGTGTAETTTDEPSTTESSSMPDLETTVATQPQLPLAIISALDQCNGNGLLSATTCECASGYRGVHCTEQCSANDRSCWTGYSQPPAITDADDCPVYCPSCSCDESENNCEHNGTYSKIPGYELSHGMCRCYCPFPWSGLTCQECNLSCANGGTLDPDTCSCICPIGFRTPDCLASCMVDISRWCSWKMAALCDRVAVIRDSCPVMCGSCTK